MRAPTYSAGVSDSEQVSRFQVIPAAYVILRRGRDVLLQLRQNTGYRDGHWATAAAGHVEAGESVLEAGVREAAEELGVSLDAVDLVPITAMHRTAGNGLAIDERVDFFFECWTWRGEPRLVEPDKAADLGWFDLAALPEPLVPHEAYVLGGLSPDGPSSPGALPAIVAFGF